VLVVFFMSVFPAFTKDADQFRELLASYPQEVLVAFGISLEGITSLMGFYSYVFTYIVLCGSIYAMNLGTSVLSKESREKTADFLLTKPVTRQQIVTSKLLAIITSLIITNVVYLLAAYGTLTVISDQSFKNEVFFLLSITAFFVELMFMALGILVSVIAPKIKSVLPVSLGTVFGFFILSMFGSVIGEEAVRYLTPFKYYDPAYIIEHASYEAAFIIIEIIFIVVSVAASYVIYSKKDIHAV
jgi:ABC-2 type transport system permease protein